MNAYSFLNCHIISCSRKQKNITSLLLPAPVPWASSDQSVGRGQHRHLIPALDDVRLLSGGNITVAMKWANGSWEVT